MSGLPHLPGLAPPPAPRIDEATLQRQLKQLFTTAGGHVYDRSQGYRKEPGGTRMTAGLADLELHFPRIRTLAVFEVKTEAGLAEHARLLQLPRERVAKSALRDWKRAQAQATYRRLCQLTDTPYGIGGFPAAWELLLSLGLAARLTPTQYQLRPGGPRPEAQP